MPNSRTRSNTAREDLLNLTNLELARLERQNRRLATMNRVIIRANAEGVLMGNDGHRYNDNSERIDEHGNVIPEPAAAIGAGPVGGGPGANPVQTLADFNRPDEFFANRSAIRMPTCERNDYELKLHYYTHVGQNPFHGLPHEFPMDHLEKLEGIVNGIKANGVSRDWYYLQLFPHSLAGEALSWLTSYPPDSFTTWEELRKEFLKYFYDDAKSEELRSKLSTFKQGPKETFRAAWTRFKKLQRDCPHHGFSQLQLLSTFFRGVDGRYQVALDAASNGNFMTKDPDSALTLIQNLTQSSGTRTIDAERMGSGGAMGGADDIQSQLAAMMNLLKGKNVACVQQLDEGAEDAENVNFVGGNGYQNQRYQNQWQNNRGNQSGYQQNNQYQRQGQGTGQNSGYNNTQQQGGQAKQPDSIANLSQKIDLLLDGQSKLIGDFNTKLDKQYTTLKTEIDQFKVHLKQLDTQVAQAAEGVKRQTGFLPGKTNPNPRDCIAVITRAARNRDHNITMDP